MNLFFHINKKIRSLPEIKFCMKEIQGHIAALYDLKEFLKDRDGEVPTQVLNAVERHEKRESGAYEKYGNKTRLVPAVGTKRVYKLLREYGAGRYIIKEVIYLID